MLISLLCCARALVPWHVQRFNVTYVIVLARFQRVSPVYARPSVSVPFFGLEQPRRYQTSRLYLETHFVLKPRTVQAKQCTNDGQVCLSPHTALRCVSGRERRTESLYFYSQFKFDGVFNDTTL